MFSTRILSPCGTASGSTAWSGDQLRLFEALIVLQPEQTAATQSATSSAHSCPRALRNASRAWKSDRSNGAASSERSTKRRFPWNQGAETAIGAAFHTDFARIGQD